MNEHSSRRRNWKVSLVVVYTKLREAAASVRAPLVFSDRFSSDPRWRARSVFVLDGYRLADRLNPVSQQVERVFHLVLRGLG